MNDEFTQGFFSGKRLLIFGAGYVGRAVAESILAQGGAVTAVTRNSAIAAELERMGVSVVVADVVGGDWPSRISLRPDFVLNCLSSGGGGVENYRRSYLEGARAIADWIRLTNQRPHYVYTGSTSFYPQSDGLVVDESMRTSASDERAEILRQTEACIVAGKGPWTILRLAGIYGPGRHYLLNRLLAGDEAVSGTAENTLNLVHRDDIVGAILLAFSHPDSSTGSVFNVADDGRATKKELVEWLSLQLGRQAPVFTGKPAPGRRISMPNRVISNALIKEKLGWRPKYPTFRDGYRALLEA